MKALVYLYDKTLEWAKHKHAPRILAGVCVAESTCFPVPPDVMLAPMVISRPDKAYWYAFLATLFSVLGGILGYFLGRYAFQPFITPMFEFFGYAETYTKALEWFKVWGLWAVLFAGFTPIPYKLFTIGAGVLQFPLGLFVLGSIIGRAARFFLVCALLKIGGEKTETIIRKIVDRVGWLMVGGVLAFVVYTLV